MAIRPFLETNFPLCIVNISDICYTNIGTCIRMSYIHIYCYIFFLCQGGVVTLEDAATVLLEEHDEKNVKYKSEFLYFKIKEIWP